MGYNAEAFTHKHKYHRPENRGKHYKKDNDEAVREMELFMIRYCDKKKLDWGTIDKFKLAKQIGARFYKEYYNAILGKRVHG